MNINKTGTPLCKRHRSEPSRLKTGGPSKTGGLIRPRLLILFVIGLVSTSCVAAPESGCKAAGFDCSLSVLTDGTVSDEASGLIWQRADSLKPLTWHDGMEYCADLELAGHSDWELPPAAELNTLYANTAGSGQDEITGINNYVFTNIHETYWSATTEGSASTIHVLDAKPGGDGNMGFETKSAKESNYAKCVRRPAVDYPSGLETGVVHLAAGWDHTCAQLKKGGVTCWGANDTGQLGDGTKIARSEPKPVSGLKPGTITQLVSGYLHTCAVFNDGTAQCWGHNYDGQLGEGTSQLDRLKPVNVGLIGIKAMALGAYHSCALLTTGAVKCWGLGQLGALGDGFATDSTLPVSPTGLGTSVTAIAAGIAHSCALLTDGTVKCWGLNRTGEIGDGSLDARDTPVAVAGLTGAKAIFARGGVRGSSPAGTTCALLDGNTLKCWGANGYGQLGNGSMGVDGDGTADQLEPATVDLQSGTLSFLALGLEHACAIKATGLACWGRNDMRQMGDGTSFSRSAPTLIGSEAAAHAVEVAAGGSHTCVLNQKGAVACWGSNRLGQLGHP